MTAHQLRQAAKELAAKGGRSATGTAKRRPRAHYVRAGKASVIARNWISVGTRNPRTEGVFPVITRGSPHQWQAAIFTGDHWYEADCNPDLIVPTNRLDVVAWFPLVAPDGSKKKE